MAEKLKGQVGEQLKVEAWQPQVEDIICGCKCNMPILPPTIELTLNSVDFDLDWIPADKSGKVLGPFTEIEYD